MNAASCWNFLGVARLLCLEGACCVFTSSSTLENPFWLAIFSNMIPSVLLVSLCAATALAAQGPCDIYDAAKTPCVAAHSVTRALYGQYTGNLYQITRASDNKTNDVSTLGAGGAANAATQDAFCGSSACAITRIYDQSPVRSTCAESCYTYRRREARLTPHIRPPGPTTPTTNRSSQHFPPHMRPRPISTHISHTSFHHIHCLQRANHLDLAPPGGAAGHEDKGVNATKEALTLNGAKVYAAFFEGGMGYRNDNTSGVAVGDEPESMYMVTGGKHFNGGCCFDVRYAHTAPPLMPALDIGPTT